MTVNKKRYPHQAQIKDGKKGPAAAPAAIKKTVKYTIERSKDDIKNLHETIGILEYYFSKSYNTDAQIYRDLPKLTVKLDDIAQDLRKANDKLTVKLQELQDLKSSICRIIDISKEK